MQEFHQKHLKDRSQQCSQLFQPEPQLPWLLFLISQKMPMSFGFQEMVYSGVFLLCEL
jgi:hypothetical protein